MKKLIFFLLISIFTFQANAQSKNTLIFSNALEKDKKMQRAGTALMIIGGATFFTGNILYRKVYNDYSNGEPPENKVNTYKYVMFGGLGVMAVGIPLWAIGTIKERQIRLDAQLVKFNGTASIYGMGIKIRF